MINLEKFENWEIQKIIDEIEEMIKNNDTKENIEIKRKELDKLLNRYIEKL